MKNKKILLMACLLSLQTLIHAAEELLALVAVKPVAKPAGVVTKSNELVKFLQKMQSGALRNEPRFHPIIKQLDSAQSNSPLALVAPLSNENTSSITMPSITEITTQDRATQTDRNMLAIQSTEDALEGLKGIHLTQLTTKQVELDSAQATFLQQIQARDQTLRNKEEMLTAEQQRATQLESNLAVRNEDIRILIAQHRTERDATTDVNNAALRAKDAEKQTALRAKDVEIARAKEALIAQQKTLEETQTTATARQIRIVALEKTLETKEEQNVEAMATLEETQREHRTTLEETQREHRTTLEETQREHRTTLAQTEQAAQNAHRSMTNRFLGLGAGLGVFTIGRSIFSTVMPSLADSTAAKIATGLAAATGAWYLGKSWPSVTMPSFKKVATCGAILGASLFSGLSGNFDGMGLRLLTGATLGAGAACFGRVWTARQEATEGRNFA